MQKTSIQAKVISSAKGGSDISWTIKISNTTDKMAFFIRPQLMVDSEEVLPCFWSASYFALAPSETITVTVGCPEEKIIGKTPEIKISGWNVNEQLLLIN
jgi:hypothetical protein